MRKKIFFTLFVFFLSLKSFAAREVPPGKSWKTLKTNHFDVIYDAQQAQLAKLYAEKLELAYFRLTPFFTEFPSRTIVVIEDKTDQTNGYATPIPYPHIVTFPVIPGPSDSLSDYGDWIYELLVHEYVHILNLTPANGFMTPLKVILGTIIAPNVLLPNWWKEGLAVQMETTTSRHGRLRSYYQDATLRAMSNNNQLAFVDLSIANENIPVWPEGMNPYLYGSIFWSYVQAENGQTTANIMNQHHSRRVPYFIEAVPEAATGKNYRQLFYESMRDTQLRAHQQITALQAEPLSNYKKSWQLTQYSSQPRISPDGKYLAHIAVTETDSRGIQIYQRQENNQSFLSGKLIASFDNQDDEKAKKIFDAPPSGSIQRIAWLNNSKDIVYDKVDATSDAETFSDLYIYHIETKKTERLSKELRAREASPSPNDQELVYVGLSANQTYLGIWNINKKEKEILWTPEMSTRISYPAFLNESEIVFSFRQLQGKETLKKINRLTKEVSDFTPECLQARFVQPSTNQLVMSCANNGVYNLYQLKDHQLVALTHSDTQMTNGDFDPLTGELWVTVMTDRGPQIGVVEKDQQKFATNLPKIEPLFSDRYPEQNLPEIATDNLIITDEEYQSYQYLFPKYWLPSFGWSSVNGGFLSANIASFDPLQKHNYSLLIDYTEKPNQLNVFGAYRNEVWNIPWNLYANRMNKIYGGGMFSTTENTRMILFEPSIFRYDSDANLSVGVMKTQVDYFNQTSFKEGFQLLWQKGSYSILGTQISPEKGNSYYLGLNLFVKNESQYNLQPESKQFQQLLAGGVYYFSKYLPARHAFMIRANAIYTPQKTIKLIHGGLTQNLNLSSDALAPIYLQRGFAYGQIYGRSIFNTNIEYRLPLKTMYSGSGTDPYFLKRLSGAFVVDGTSADGNYIHLPSFTPETIQLSKIFWSAGAELRLETTIGYVLPIQWVYGIYAPLNSLDSNDSQVGLSIQIPTM
jgi:hypothetical protein